MQGKDDGVSYEIAGNPNTPVHALVERLMQGKDDWVS